MEGTYLNPKFGCDLANNHWAGPIRREDYLPLVEAAGDFAKVWCLAPEREGIPGFVRDLKERIPSIVLSVAHSEATPQEVERYIPEGLRLAPIIPTPPAPWTNTRNAGASVWMKRSTTTTTSMRN